MTIVDEDATRGAMRWLFGGRASWSIAMAVVCFAPRAMAADCMANDGSELTSCVAQLEAGDTLTLAAGTFEIYIFFLLRQKSLNKILMNIKFPHY